MEVILILFLIVSFSTCIYLYNKNRHLKNENSTIGEILSKEIKDSERQIEDQRATELELQIVKSKLEVTQQSSLTPDNSIPKQIHLDKVKELGDTVKNLQEELKTAIGNFEKVRGKQISERVRLGQVGENFAAFHDQFPYDRKQVKALFQPIDLIYFGQDEIVFIDVKTGDSKLNKKQRIIRDNINKGNIRFEVHRIDQNGYRIDKGV